MFFSVFLNFVHKIVIYKYAYIFPLGIELGNTKLVFSIGDTASVPIDLQVFPPLKVYPKNITLVIGSTIQFVTKGGPQPEGNVEYSADVKDISRKY